MMLVLRFWWLDFYVGDFFADVGDFFQFGKSVTENR